MARARPRSTCDSLAARAFTWRWHRIAARLGDDRCEVAPWYNTSGWVGYEAYDVGYIPCGNLQVPRRRCRTGRLHVGRSYPSFGRIANTTGWYSTTVSQTDTLEIIGVELFPLNGETVQKVGRTTGKTFGDVYYTCTDRKQVDDQGVQTDTSSSARRWLTMGAPR
jgi:hypothetical protein